MILREALNARPWMGWAVAGAFLVIALVVAMRGFTAAPDAYSPERMSEIVTIRFTDTGDTMDIPRGRLIKLLAEQRKTLDVNQGLINPKTNQPTGFPFDKDDWAQLIARINEDQAEGAGSRGTRSSPPSR